MATPTQGESTQLSVSNFGPITKAEIDLRPLTVFVGPSNTGKSYLAILIYTLHKFFSDYAGLQDFRFGQMSMILRESIGRHQHLDDDSVKELADWFVQIANEGKLNDDIIQLPDFVTPMFRPLFSQVSNFSQLITEELKRSFGFEENSRLIRRGNSNDAKVILGFKPFEYELRLKRDEPIGSVNLSSEETPLYINPHTQEINEARHWAENIQMRGFSILRGDDGQFVKEHFISSVLSSVISHIISPLDNAAHYLPADRTGVMHAHRVVVASLIERAPRAGLRRDRPLPELSGVLADFLEQLIRLGERRRGSRQRSIATNFEQQIIKGVIRSKNSETGYPIFSYQPERWTEDLPLMNSSSMVSELAPVILYLRHIVQPGDVLIIEEPESHLHPAMQVEFIRQLAAVVNSGIRVMLTTHSEWVLDELANLVYSWDLPKKQRKGITSADFALNPDNVGVWLFEPKQRPRGSVVKEIRFDEEFGGFRSGFDQVAMGTYNDYAKISNRIERSRPHDESH